MYPDTKCVSLALFLTFWLFCWAQFSYKNYRIPPLCIQEEQEVLFWSFPEMAAAATVGRLFWAQKVDALPDGGFVNWENRRQQWPVRGAGRRRPSNTHCDGRGGGGGCCSHHLPHAFICQLYYQILFDITFNALSGQVTLSLTENGLVWLFWFFQHPSPVNVNVVFCHVLSIMFFIPYLQGTKLTKSLSKVKWKVQIKSKKKKNFKNGGGGNLLQHVIGRFFFFFVTCPSISKKISQIFFP